MASYSQAGPAPDTGDARRPSWQPLRSNSLPRNETAGRVPPQAASRRLRVLHLPCQQRSSLCHRKNLYQTLHFLNRANIRTAIRVRPQLNPECRVSKAHRNILRCRLAERKTILAEIWRWLLKLNSKNYISISAFLSPWIQSGRAENVRIERDALLEDISIGGTG